MIAQATIKYNGEALWPETVEIGTVVSKIGTSSLALTRGLFQNNQLVAAAETVLIQISESTRKAKPLGEDTKRALKQYVIHS